MLVHQVEDARDALIDAVLKECVGWQIRQPLLDRVRDDAAGAGGLGGGQQPIGWNAYWMRNSPHTLDILQSLGFEYHIDEPSMEEPFIVKLKAGDFVTVPYTCAERADRKPGQSVRSEGENHAQRV